MRERERHRYRDEVREKGFINSLVGVASTRLTTTFSLKEGVLVLKGSKGWVHNAHWASGFWKLRNSQRRIFPTSHSISLFFVILFYIIFSFRFFFFSRLEQFETYLGEERRIDFARTKTPRQLYMRRLIIIGLSLPSTFFVCFNLSSSFSLCHLKQLEHQWDDA